MLDRLAVNFWLFHTLSWWINLGSVYTHLCLYLFLYLSVYLSRMPWVHIDISVNLTVIYSISFILVFSFSIFLFSLIVRYLILIILNLFASIIITSLTWSTSLYISTLPSLASFAHMLLPAVTLIPHARLFWCEDTLLTLFWVQMSTFYCRK